MHRSAETRVPGGRDDGSGFRYWSVRNSGKASEWEAGFAGEPEVRSGARARSGSQGRDFVAHADRAWDGAGRDSMGVGYGWEEYVRGAVRHWVPICRDAAETDSGS